MSLWRHLDNYSPLMVRLCARRPIGRTHVIALSSQELAITSGLPVARIVEISWFLNWDEVRIAEARLFCAACNFDPTLRIHRERQASYTQQCLRLRPNQFPAYLRRSPHWETEFLPLIQHLKSSPPPSGASLSSASRLPNSSVSLERTHAA